MILHCFPHAGGTGAPYRDWTVPTAGVEVRVMTYHPGVAGPYRATVQEMAAACAARIEPGPFAFFGHSLGALVAFETVRELRGAGRPGPGVLFVSGHVAPHLPSPGRVLHNLPAAEFWDEVAALGGTPAEMRGARGERHAAAEIRALAEPRLRAELRAAETYRYRPGAPLDCDVVALAGESDARAPQSGVAAWRMHTTGAFELLVLPGGHFFIESARQDVLDALGRALRRVAGDLRSAGSATSGGTTP